MASDRKKNNTLICLFVLLVFYFNNETLANNLCTYINQPCRLVAALGIALLIIRMLLRRVIPAQQSVVFAVMVVLVFASSLVDEGQTNGYFLVIMNLLIAYCTICLVDFHQFKSLYVQFMSVISGASLVCNYFLKPILQRIPALFPHVYNSVGNGFVNAHLCYIMNSARYFRNYGIFREPGIFATFLCLGLIFLLEDRTICRRIKLVMTLLITGIVSTFSTTGYLTTAAIISIHFLNKRKLSRRANAWLVFVIIVFLVPIFWNIGNDNLFGEVFQKLNSEHSSMRYRIETIANGLTVSWHNMFFGAGILKGTEQMREMNTMLRYHNTSTIIAMLVYFGLAYLLLFVYMLFQMFNRRVGNWMYIIPVFLLLNSQQFLYNTIWYALMLYGSTWRVKVGGTR